MTITRLERRELVSSAGIAGGAVLCTVLVMSTAPVRAADWKMISCKRVSVLAPASVTREAENTQEEIRRGKESFGGIEEGSAFLVDVDQAGGMKPLELRKLTHAKFKPGEKFLGDVTWLTWGGIKYQSVNAGETTKWTQLTAVDNEGRTLVTLTTSAEPGSPKARRFFDSLSFAATNSK